MFNKIKFLLTAIILNWSFVWGSLTATALFSSYIFGNDNLYEETVEWLSEIIYHENIDFSPSKDPTFEADLYTLIHWHK